MIKRVKIWMYTAALFGGTMFLFGGGCGWGLDGNARTLLAILQEDIFG